MKINLFDCEIVRRRRSNRLGAILHTTEEMNVKTETCGPVYIRGDTEPKKQQAEVIQNHENENVRYIGQGEAPHRKYKRLKLDGGHVYDCSSV
jgi:hypothetical protein